MRIQQRMVGDVVIIDLNGNLRLGDGDELLRDMVNRLMQQGRNRLVLNLADASYMDSAGLGQIVRSYTTALNHGGALKLLRPTQRVKDLFIVTKLWSIFEVFESEEDAVRSFPPPAGA